MYAKSIDFRKRNLFSSWIRTPDLLNASQFVLPIEPYSCGFQWNVARVFSTSSSSTRCIITAFTRCDKLEVGRWWVYDDVSSSRRVISVTDRQMDGFSALYIDAMYKNRYYKQNCTVNHCYKQLRRYFCV